MTTARGTWGETNMDTEYEEMKWSQQTEDSENICSQGSFLSSIPSPVYLKIGNFLSEDNFDGLKNEENIKILNVIIPKLTSIDGILEANVNHLVKLIGSHCHQKIKSEAQFYRLKRSREDDVSFQPEEILDKQQNIELLHVFFDSVTQKGGRQPGENRGKIAQLQANFYESILKGTNLCAVGPYSLTKTKKLFGQNLSKQMLEGNLGGSYSFHNKQSITEPLPVTRIGPLISDNAQKGED